MKDSLRVTMNRLRHQRGDASEARIDQIILTSIQNGIAPAWITGYTTSSERDDQRGIDGWVNTDVGKIPLQIKSSSMGKTRALEKRPDVPVVVTQAGEAISVTLASIISAIAPKRDEYLEMRKQYYRI